MNYVTTWEIGFSGGFDEGLAVRVIRHKLYLMSVVSQSRNFVSSGPCRCKLKRLCVPVCFYKSHPSSNAIFVPVDAPARLKKELDTVLVLQGDLDAVDRTLERTKATIKKSVPGSRSLVMIDSLERTHERLKDKVEALYTSLNVHDSFPELASVDLEFVRTLLMARDLKINIRKRAVGSFFEWERLDRAVGGHAQALGRF
jgi:hypothetical protein